MLLNNLFSRVLMSEERESFYRSLEDEAFVIFFLLFFPPWSAFWLRYFFQ